MMKKSVSLLASLLLLLPLLTLAEKPIDSKKTLPNSVETKPTQIGPIIPQGYVPIKNVKAPSIQGMGKFAVDEHNKQKGDHLKFLEVYAGEKQIFAANYKLKIRTAIDGLPFSYEADIFVGPKRVMYLLSFKEIVLIGGYGRIENVKTPSIQDFGKFAVDDYNIQKRVNLKFNEVYDGASQVVNGVNKKLLLTATDGGKLRKYLTVVYLDHNYIPYLTSFDPIP